MLNAIRSLAWTAAIFAAGINAACTSFEVVKTPYSERGQSNQVNFLRKAAPPVFRVSPGLVCSDSTHTKNCPGNTCSPSITNGTWLTAPGRSNLTFNTPEDVQSIYSIAGTALNISFPWIAGTTMGDPNATSFNTCIPNTIAGYVVFTTNYNCAQGILRCQNGPFPDNTAAQLCAPIVSGSNSQLQGALVVTTAPASAVSTLGAIESTPSPTITFTADGLKAVPTGTGITQSKSAGSALTIQHVSISSFSVYTGTLVAFGTAALAVLL